MKKKKNIYIVFSLIIGIICLVLIFFVFDSKTDVTIKYNESLPKFKIYSYEDELIDNNEVFNDSIVFYLKESCSACLSALSTYSTFINDNRYDKYSVILLWEDSIPIKKIIESGISLELNFRLKDKIRLSKITPFIFVINSETRVHLLTNNLDYLESSIVRN